MSSASGTTYVGELFIGSADGNGNISKGSVSFASRPSALKIHYKYAPYNSEMFSATITLYNGATPIASGGFSDGASAASWTSRTIPLTYSDQSLKATHIHVSFKPTTSDSPGVKTNTSIEYNGKSESGLFGSQLRLDDLQLIYE